MRRHLSALVVALVGLATSGCELTEVTSTAAEDRVVVEGLVRLGLPRPGQEPVSDPDRDHLWATVLLHRTVQGAQGANAPVPGARVELILDGGQRVRLDEGALSECAQSTPIQGTGSCYSVRILEQDPGSGGLHELGPGDRVELEIETAEGERLESTTFIPGSFVLEGPQPQVRCVLPPDTPYPVEWSPSAGAWAYVAETEIYGLRVALAAEGIETDDLDEPLFLLGLSVGADDTTIVFPGEFGVFDRFDLDRDVAVRLQRGLPANTTARVAINAVDRNYVNWIRGGNFNPSGQVRIPSVLGDGTGFFGSSITRWFVVVSSTLPDAGAGLPPCPVG